MDKETRKIIDEVAAKAAADAVAKVREFHQDDLKALSERMEMGFESSDRQFSEIREDISEIKTDIVGIKTDIVGINQRLDSIDTRLDRLEDAFGAFLKEFREDKEKVRQLEAQIVELTRRVALLETQLMTSK